MYHIAFQKNHTVFFQFWITLDRNSVCFRSPKKQVTYLFFFVENSYHQLFPDALTKKIRKEQFLNKTEGMIDFKVSLFSLSRFTFSGGYLLVCAACTWVLELKARNSIRYRSPTDDQELSVSFSLDLENIFFTISQCFLDKPYPSWRPTIP